MKYINDLLKIIRKILFFIILPIWIAILFPVIAIIAVFLLNKISMKILGKDLCRKFVRKISKYGISCTLFITKLFCNLTYKVEGVEHIPADKACVIMSKHQSFLDTIFLVDYIDNPIFILKKELFYIPFLGFFLKKMDFIWLDRGKMNKSSMANLIKQVDHNISNGRTIIIFPEGTRVPVGKKVKYKSGIGFIYECFKDKISFIPVALNSGLYSKKSRFFMKEGGVTIRILPPIDSDLDKKELVKQTENIIETETDKLISATSSIDH